jgi:predicted permease
MTPGVYQAVARLMALFSRKQIEREFDEELTAHIEFLIEENTRRGMDEETARREALLEIGSVDAARELHRDARSLQLVESIAQDIRFGARQLRRSPAFTIVTVLILAIGIGTNTAVFSQVNAVFWKAQPFENPQELRALAWTSAKRSFTGHDLGPRSYTGLTFEERIGSFSYAAYVTLRNESTLFSDLACWNHADANLRDWGRVETQLVSGNYFHTIGMHAAAGRLITPFDDQVGQSPLVAVVSDHFRERAFHDDAGVLQRTVTINGTAFQVVGVLPKGFYGLDPAYAPDVILPMASHAAITARPDALRNRHDWTTCQIVGRLKSAASEEEARGQAETVLREFIVSDPPDQAYEPPKLWVTEAGQGLDSVRRPTLRPLALFMSAGAVLLLIVCANVAGLLFGRGSARLKEMATRLALGAPRPRVVRQVFIECLMLSLIGGTVALGLTYTLSPLLPMLLDQFVDRPFSWPAVLGVDATPDLRVLGFSFALAAFTSVAFGTAPALRLGRVNPQSIIKTASCKLGGSDIPFTGGKALVAVQAALSIVILVGAGLLIRTVINMKSEPLAFEPEGLLIYNAYPNRSGYDRARHFQFFENAIDQLEKTPGIVSVSASATPLLVAGKTTVCAPGSDLESTTEHINVNSVTPRFFETWGLSLLAGRSVDWRDREGTSRSAVVNQAFARKFFVAANPIGQQFRLNCSAPVITVVGLVVDTKISTRLEVRPTVYLSYRQAGSLLRTLTLRTNGDYGAVMTAVRQVMRSLDPDVPILDSMTPVQLRDLLIKRERFSAGLLICFSLAGLLLSCMGLYSMLAYAVSERTAEISIRMALGARSRQIVHMVVRESIAPVIIGLTIGLAGAFALTHWVDGISGYLKATLFGVPVHDPLVVLGAAILFLLTGAVACAVPAARACSVSPMRALRHE